MAKVEDCKNWSQMTTGLLHCWNCANRNGYPYRAQPNHSCKNCAVDKPKKIRLLCSMAYNDIGDIVTVLLETETDLYYNDSARRYTMIEKSLEGKEWEWVGKNKQSPLMS